MLGLPELVHALGLTGAVPEVAVSFLEHSLSNMFCFVMQQDQYKARSTFFHQFGRAMKLLLKIEARTKENIRRVEFCYENRQTFPLLSIQLPGLHC